MTKYKYLLLLIFLSTLHLSNAQNKKALKEIKRIINANELIYIQGGEFNSGSCSVVRNRKKLVENEEIYLQEIPARRTCESFLISNHEVTVGEYLEFVFSVTGQTKLNNIPIGDLYSFALSGEKVYTPILPEIAYMGGMEKLYLTDKKYRDYPIMGVSWLQANAYIQWLNSNLNKTLSNSSISHESMQFILPTHLQWEYAGLKSPDPEKEKFKEIKYYPWEGQELTSKKGKYKANFGPIETKYGVMLKKYHDDEHTYPAPTKSYPPHNNLYDMAGNVSEWTSSLHSTSDTSTATIDGVLVKGGSYMSNPIFMQLGVSQIYTKEVQSNEIGFRIGMKIEKELMEKLNLE